MAKYVTDISLLLQSSIPSAMASYNHILLLWLNITRFSFSSLLLVRSYPYNRIQFYSTSKQYAV